MKKYGKREYFVDSTMWKGVNAISRSLFEMEELFDGLSVAGQNLVESLQIATIFRSV